MGKSRSEIKRTISAELERYQVTFEFGHGGKHPFVLIAGRDGNSEKVCYSETPRVANTLQIRGDLRRAIKRLRAEPWPEERRAARIGTLGDALMDAATPEPIIVPADKQKDFTMTTLTPPAKTNGAHSAPPKPVDAPKTLEYTKLRQGEVVQLTLLISENAKIDHDVKEVEYLPGWDDERLLLMLKAAPGREKLTIGHIANFRRESFGLIAAERDPPPPEGRAIGTHVMHLRKRVASLEDRVKALEDAVTTPRQ